MARPRQKTFVDRLADVGEDAIQRLSGAPGGERLLGTVNTLRDRMDDMQKQLRALATTDKRLAAIERRLDKLEGKKTTPTRRRTTTSRTRKKSTTTRKKSA